MTALHAPPADVFRALSDPTRIAVVERLGIGPASTSELATPSGISLPSFTEHLALLERVGLVTSSKQGRVRTYRLTPEPLEQAGAWLADQRAHWKRRLDQLDGYLAATPTPTAPDGPAGPNRIPTTDGDTR
jgi:DNA-binding transcriptional ArsR family regulator